MTPAKKFKKRHGTRNKVENTLGWVQYEDEITQNSRNCDISFDYVRLEDRARKDLREEGTTQGELADRVQEVYEQTVSQVPPGGEKRHCGRYIFLWLDYGKSKPEYV